MKEYENKVVSINKNKEDRGKIKKEDLEKAITKSIMEKASKIKW
tara:strand:- start:2151 stop:2282 length:132 start_codon:yes stop_codon:yes gene_type:complete